MQSRPGKQSPCTWPAHQRVYRHCNCKATFCRAFVKEMSNFSSAQFDAAAVSTGRHLPVESAMPGTTLQIIPLQAFESGGVLYGRYPPLNLHQLSGCLPSACAQHAPSLKCNLQRRSSLKAWSQLGGYVR